MVNYVTCNDFSTRSNMLMPVIIYNTNKYIRTNEFFHKSQLSIVICQLLLCSLKNYWLMVCNISLKTIPSAFKFMTWHKVEMADDQLNRNKKQRLVVQQTVKPHKQVIRNQ